MYGKIFMLLCLIVAVSSDSDCANVKCDVVPKHYKELGCTPVLKDNECCPSRFECPDKAQFALDKCYLNQKGYSIGEQASPENITRSLCLASCYCAEGFPEGKPAEFRCAQIECPHFFNSELNNCDHKYTLNSCCPKYLCTEDEKKSVGASTCEVEGKSYRVGATIYPNSVSCYKCVCDEHFDNSTIIGNPFCTETKCGIEIRYLTNYREGCIPNYYGKVDCCPIGWRCPEQTDIMIPSESRSTESVDPKAQCQFGNLTLHVGDEIKSANECDICKCITPPMAYCIKKANC